MNFLAKSSNLSERMNGNDSAASGISLTITTSAEQVKRAIQKEG